MIRVKFIAAACLAASLAGVASASVVTRQFQFQSDVGGLQFGPTIGSFSYDDAVAPLAGGLVSAVNLFTQLDVQFAGLSFDETTANSGWLRFGAGGNLLEAHFGTSCGAGFCTLSGGTKGWWIRVGLDDPSYFAVNDFAYSGYGREESIRYTNKNVLLPLQAVPEPASLALAGLALVAAGAASARRRSA